MTPEEVIDVTGAQQVTSLEVQEENTNGRRTVAGRVHPSRVRRPYNYAKLTCSACRPLGPRFTTNDTRAPSSRVRYPPDSIAEKWTNTSSPFSLWIKPNPLAALNHFTVPVSFMYLSFVLCDH